MTTSNPLEFNKHKNKNKNSENENKNKNRLKRSLLQCEKINYIWKLNIDPTIYTNLINDVA